MAVTGDVGAGKSTVSKMFESRGWVLIDADRVVADLWREPAVVSAAAARWGGGVLENGRVVHARVAAIIFSDMTEYAWTTGLLHPLVREEMSLRVNAQKREGKPVVAEIPMLFESGPAPWVTHKTFVAASREVRLKRCLTRGWDAAEVTRRESFFLPAEERMALSDFVIRNEGDLEELKRTVDAIGARIE
jgi:dephospho-CoA kinase